MPDWLSWRAKAAALVGSVVLSGACSDPAVSKAVGTGAAAVPIVVTTTAAAVILENHAGRPLLDARVTIETDQGVAFVSLAPAIDAGVAVELALATFRNGDGAMLDPSSIHPRSVSVAARDTLANTYRGAAAWTP
jgi:hypothetical protein